MSKAVMTRTIGGRKLSREEAELVQELRTLAIDLVFYHHEIGLPKRKSDIFAILYCFIELTTPPPHEPRDIAKLVDQLIADKLKQGTPLEEAVPYARTVYAKLLQKSFKAVKMAHLRYGTVGVTKKQKL